MFLIKRLLHPQEESRIYTSKSNKNYKATIGKKDTVISVNGIFGAVDGWEVKYADWINANTPFSAAGYYYWTGLFLSGQSKHANELAQLIRDERKANGGKIYLIGHSNGCQLILDVLKSNTDISVDGVFLIAASLYHDCRTGWWKNSINDLQKRLGFVVCG